MIFLEDVNQIPWGYKFDFLSDLEEKKPKKKLFFSEKILFLQIYVSEVN